MATRQSAPVLGAPPGLVVETFERGGESFAVLDWPAPHPRPPSDLRPAEREILEWLLAGFSTAEIARRRRRSARTVAHQVDAIFRRLGVHSRQELMARCFGGDP
jgi:DNA-binding CsgD family transcriptional regulator